MLYCMAKISREKPSREKERGEGEGKRTLMIRFEEARTESQKMERNEAVNPAVLKPAVLQGFAGTERMFLVRAFSEFELGLCHL